MTGPTEVCAQYLTEVHGGSASFLTRRPPDHEACGGGRVVVTNELSEAV